VENKTVEMVVKDLLLADNQKKLQFWFLNVLADASNSFFY